MITKKSLVASNMYTAMEGKPVKVTKADNERRQIGKIMGLKLNYGGSAFTVKDDLGVPIEEAEKFVKAFIDAFPEKEEYYKEGIAFTKQNGFILTNSITRRKIFPHFYDRWKELRFKPFHERSKDEIREFAKLNGRLERMVKNYRIQGTAADQTKLACIYLFRNIRSKYPKVKIVAVVHDEIILESPEEIAKQVLHDLQEAMESAANLVANNKDIVFPAEPKITKIWQK